MKRLLSITMTVLLAALLMVSCNVETGNIDDSLALITFSAGERETRSLTRTNPQLDPDDFYWTYKATKKDGTGLTTGATATEKAVVDGAKGLGTTVGPFSFGVWEFELFGYADEAKTKLAYQGTSELIISEKTNTLAVTVEAQSSTGTSGYLQVPAKGAITLKLTDGTAISAYDTFVEKVYIKNTDTSNTFTKTVYIDSTDVTNIELASGSYAVTVSYQNKKDPEANDTDKTAPIVYAEDTIYVTIADYLTTKIGGDIKENNGSVELIAQGEIIKAKTTETLSTTEATVLTVNAAPVISAASEAVPETKVSIPADALTTTATSASVTVTAYSATSIAEGDASADFTIENTEDTTKPVLGALDIKLYVDNSADPTTTFAEGKVLTITTKIAKGLDQTKIKVKYNGTGTDGTVTAYDAKTGELTFTVSHLSTYYVIAEDACIYNASKDMAYESIDDAVAAASEGDTLILLDCSKSNDVSDEAADAYNWSVIHNNCASAAEGYWHEKSDSFDGGYGTKVEPYLVSSFEQLEKIDSEKWSDYAYYKWTVKDGTLDASNWDPSNLYLHGSFDGNGLTVNDLDYFMFRAVWNGSNSWNPSEDTVNTYTIKNLTINAKIISSGQAAAVVRTVGVHNFVMENVTVHGYIEGSYHVASFVSYGPGNYVSGTWQYCGNITFKNCHSDATVVATGESANGFIAHAMMTSDGKINLIDSDFTGKLAATQESYLKYVVGNAAYPVITDNKSSENSGTLYQIDDAGWKYINSGKTSIMSFDDKKISDLSVNVGDVVAVDATTEATKATVALVVSPGPGCFTGAFLSEDVSPSDNKFTSSTIKRFTVRINPEGITETGIHENYYDVVSDAYDTSIDANTVIKFTQYDNAGNIVKITNISLEDKSSN